MRKLCLFCFCLIAALLLLARSPTHDKKIAQMNRMIPLLNANEPGWVLSRLDSFPSNNDGRFSLDGKINPKTGEGAVKAGYIEDMEREGLSQKTKERLDQLFVLMRLTDTDRIRKDGSGYIFFESGGRVFNRGGVYVYTSDEKKWNPTSHRSKWIEKLYKFERVDENWFQAKR